MRGCAEETAAGGHVDHVVSRREAVRVEDEPARLVDDRTGDVAAVEPPALGLQLAPPSGRRERDAPGRGAPELRPCGWPADGERRRRQRLRELDAADERCRAERTEDGERAAARRPAPVRAACGDERHRLRHERLDDARVALEHREQGSRRAARRGGGAAPADPVGATREPVPVERVVALLRLEQLVQPPDQRLDLGDVVDVFLLRSPALERIDRARVHPQRIRCNCPQSLGVGARGTARRLTTAPPVIVGAMAGVAERAPGSGQIPPRDDASRPPARVSRRRSAGRG